MHAGNKKDRLNLKTLFIQIVSLIWVVKGPKRIRRKVCNARIVCMHRYVQSRWVRQLSPRQSVLYCRYGAAIGLNGTLWSRPTSESFLYAAIGNAQFFQFGPQGARFQLEQLGRAARALDPAG